jgi:hypothetical protein
LHVSLGAAEYRSPNELSAAIERADSSVYEEKGRARVIRRIPSSTGSRCHSTWFAEIRVGISEPVITSEARDLAVGGSDGEIP